MHEKKGDRCQKKTRIQRDIEIQKVALKGEEEEEEEERRPIWGFLGTTTHSYPHKKIQE